MAAPCSCGAQRTTSPEACGRWIAHHSFPSSLSQTGKGAAQGLPASVVPRALRVDVLPLGLLAHLLHRDSSELGDVVLVAALTVRRHVHGTALADDHLDARLRLRRLDPDLGVDLVKTVDKA
jgi:hypothetical protein